ncbi:MAG: hypothetical protein IJA19_06420 [Clostridia bacterium]|nr:hypothetical protein [Clostridia bacterium]
MGYEYKFDAERCWYKDGHCQYYGTPECDSTCHRFLEMDYLMWASKIPPARQTPFTLIPNNVDVPAFLRLKSIKDNITSFVAQGRSLYLFSENTGNGKTAWGIKLLQSYFNHIWNGNRFRCRGVFVFVPKFLNDLKNDPRGKNPDFKEFLDNVIKADVVVWDDIGANKLTDYEHANLLSFIDQRRLNLQSNIYTGNLDSEKLRDYVGERLYSRIWEDSERVQLLGNSRRGTNGSGTDS